MKSCDAGYSAVHDPARSIVASLGLAAMLATLLVYSGAVTPFQRYDLLRTFIDCFPSVALESAFLAAVVVLVLSAVGKRIPLRVINWVGGGLFIMGDLAFCAMAILGSPGDWAPVVDGVACGIGSCAVCLAWGRVMRRCDLRSATLCVCVATMLAVLLGLGMYVLPVPVAIAMFVVCVGLAAAVPIVYASDSPCVAVGEERIPAIATANKAGKASRTSVPEVEHDAKADAGGDSPFSRMRSFLDVATAPAIGLALFAFIMGVRGESVVVDYPYVLIAQLVASTLILVCMFALRGSPLTRVVYRGLIPIVSVCVMAVVSVSRLIPNGFGA